MHPSASSSNLVLLVMAALLGGCAAGGAEQSVDPDEGDALVLEGDHRVGDPVSHPPLAPRVEIENAGELCLFEANDELAWFAEGEQSFRSGDRLTFRVAVPGCLSSSCDVNRFAACEVTTKGSTIVVESYLAYDALEEGRCTMDCGRLWATCESEPLELGVYDVVHGNDVRELMVPSTVDACAATACETDEDCPDGYCDQPDGVCVPKL